MPLAALISRGCPKTADRQCGLRTFTRPDDRGRSTIFVVEADGECIAFGRLTGVARRPYTVDAGRAYRLEQGEGEARWWLGGLEEVSCYLRAGQVQRSS